MFPSYFSWFSQTILLTIWETMKMFWPPWRCWTSPSWRPWTTPNGWVLPPAPWVSQAQSEQCKCCIKEHINLKGPHPLQQCCVLLLCRQHGLWVSGVGFWMHELLLASLRGLLETSCHRAAYKSRFHLGRHPAFQIQLLMCEAAVLETRGLCLKDHREIMQAPKPRHNALFYMCKEALSP